MSFRAVREWAHRRGGNVYLGGTSDFGTEYSCWIPAEKDALQTMLHYFGTATISFADGRYYEFDSSGLLTSMVDRHGNSTSFSYSGGLLTTVGASL